VRRLNITNGQKFGRLVVLHESPKRVNRKIAWVCQCACGASRIIVGSELVSGHRTSCGCRVYKHGYLATGLRPSEYYSWSAMITRCYNPKCRGYKRYGGRGIVVCDEWRHSFSSFMNSMGTKPSPIHTLDRVNVNGNYEPRNCRWATPAQQAENRRKYGALSCFSFDELIEELKSRVLTRSIHTCIP
jgi:hypothetical protein